MEKHTANILIVEDELITALDLKLILQKYGHKIIKIVSSGEDAVKTAISAHPDAVLMDINIKGRMNGLEAAEVILDYKIPVLFITSQNDQETIQRMNKISGNYIIKPFHEFILEKKIEMIMDN